MILHIDMDAFYASVEQLDSPWLKGKCVIVGGRSKRSVVSAASYEARKYGVHSAMPIFQAMGKCPDGIVIPPRMKRYKEVSRKIMALLKTFSPLVEPVSIDEAYVDISGCDRLYGNPEETGFGIKKAIKEELNLTCSVGVAPNKFLAKIASDMDKPDGLYIISPEQVDRFVETLPVQKVPGVGKTTLRQLSRMGIKRLGDVKNYPEETLLKRLGKFGHRLMALSSCEDSSVVQSSRSHKSISTECTFSEDTDDLISLKKILLNQSQEVARDLRHQKVKAKTVTLKIKHSDFKLVTRSHTLTSPTRSSETVYREAVQLLDRYRLKKKVRLIGVGASGFVTSDIPVQQFLFGQEKRNNEDWESVDRAVDTITQKFGKGIIKRATLKD